MPDKSMSYGEKKTREEGYGMHVVRFGILKRVPWEGHEKVISEQGSTDGFPGDTRIHFCSPATSWLLPMYDTYDAVLPFGR